ncbi:MAG: hypothetical protein FVQ82_17870 [Planctomycetes bacterium]|nr:hypothetical protein [Planctomycetota bacterium]
MSELMIELISLVVVVYSALWVYLDATKHKIGPTEGGGFWNMSAGTWAIWILGLWIISFHAYIVKRKALIEKAKLSPVEPKNRTWGIVVFAFVGVLAIIVGVLFASVGDNFSSYYDNVVVYDNVFHDNIITVKEGNFTACQGYKIGSIIDKFLYLPDWSSFVGEDGKSYVDVSGKYKFTNKPVDFSLQFVVDDQTGSFNVQALKVNGVPQNNLIIVSLVDKLCNSILLYEKISDGIPYRMIDLLDLKIDYYKLLSEKIIVSGFGQMFGELFILKNDMMDLNPLWVDINNVDREGRRYAISKCSLGCKITVFGIVKESDFGKGILATKLEW